MEYIYMKKKREKETARMSLIYKLWFFVYHHHHPINTFSILRFFLLLCFVSRDNLQDRRSIRSVGKKKTNDIPFCNVIIANLFAFFCTPSYVRMASIIWTMRARVKLVRESLCSFHLFVFFAFFPSPSLSLLLPRIELLYKPTYSYVCTYITYKY